MRSIHDEPKLMAQILSLIASHFGSHCEVVLHDLTGSYEHTITDIRNGHITGRSVGGCGSNLGLEVLSGSTVDGDRFNYVTSTPDGKILRSSSIYLRDDDGEVIGSICVNLDITDSVRMEDYLRQFNNYETSPQEEVFAQDVGHLLQFLIRQAQGRVGKAPEDMSREERITFLRYLDEKGAFMIQKSGDRVCEVLGVSKFTLYHDLEGIRERGARGERVGGRRKGARE